ncbi:hypothetical protein DL762_008808 [Monosporascus cannonballus]|uniref:DUF1308 domain-containing protein n=1 Tax=Monosporascus cannonballus TaxID=155416 RepID=A0ABY0GV60_9PEZI|nr:hypothetical protein DL762_008808 [Monosporascus cannonballus]
MLARANLEKVDALLGEMTALNDAYQERRKAATRFERRDMPIDLPGLNDLIASSKGLRHPLEKVVRARSGGNAGVSSVGDEQQEERDRKDMIVLSSVGNHPGAQRWDAIKRCHGLAALRRQFPLGDKRLSPPVDAVVENGAEWLKVSVITERKLVREMAEDGWHPDDSDDDSSDSDGDGEGTAVSIVRVVALLVKAARLNRCRSRPPRVHIYLPNIFDGPVSAVDRLLCKVRRAGIPKGDERPVEVTISCANSAFAKSGVPPLEMAFANLLRNTQLDRLTPTLNMELTLLISLVSDITHGDTEMKPWYGTQTVSHIKDEEQAPGARLKGLYSVIRNKHLHVPQFSSGAHRKEGAIPSEDHDLTSRFQALSIYPVPEGLRLPIRAVSKDEFDDSRENVEALIEAHALPRVALDVFDKLDRQYHRACYLYGWAKNITTVSANSLTVQQVYAVVNKSPDIGPDIFCAPLVVGLNTVRPCPEDRWNGLKDAKHARRDAREKEAKAMKEAGAWGPALGVRSK